MADSVDDPTPDMPTRRSDQEIKDSTELRIKYSLFKMSMVERKSELVRPDSTGLLELLDEMNVLFERVKTPREAAFDSDCLIMASELANERASNLQTNIQEFDRSVFANELRKLMSSGSSTGELDWSKLGKVATNLFNAPAKLDLIYGPLATEYEIKKRAASKRTVQKKPEESAKKKPQQIVKQDQEESTTKEVQRVLKAVHRLTGTAESPYPHVPFFELIIHPTSFSTTIENLFHLSFLVKDGRVKLFLDEDDIPVVKFGKKVPAGSNTGSSAADIPATPGTTRAVHPSQVIVSMTMEKWRSLIRELGITESMMG